MQITVTLDSDVLEIIRSRMRERRVSFNDALNEIIRHGHPPRFRTETASMGEPSIDLTQALSLAGELEDIHRIQRMTQDQP